MHIHATVLQLIHPQYSLLVVKRLIWGGRSNETTKTEVSCFTAARHRPMLTSLYEGNILEREVKQQTKLNEFNVATPEYGFM